MKKFTGWLILIGCSFIFLSFLSTFILIIPGILSDNPETSMKVSEVIIFFAGFSLVTALLMYGIKSGLARIKKEQPPEVIEFVGTLDLNFSGKIAYDDYRKLIMNLSLKKPYYLIVACMVILFCLSIVVKNEGLPALNSTDNYIYFMLGIALVTPVTIWFRIKNLYQQNKIFSEEMEYHLTNEGIQIKGSSVDSKQKWSNFIRTKESNDFFLLYHDKVIATLIYKKLISVTDQEIFRQFLKSLPIARS